MNKIIEFFKEVMGEAKNITWPTRKQAISSTILVIAVSILVAYYLGFLDKIFAKVLQFLLLNY
ncbi:TPA: preprotein translocase subunit SecE [Candidatus Nomurabacteria bacterium]|nr:preprotein translocase subunit SecE [Candidatus Nomurabacteria bacterium]